MFLPRNRAGAVLWRRWRLRPAMQLPPRRVGQSQHARRHYRHRLRHCRRQPRSDDRYGHYSLGQIIRDGQGMTKPFSIELVNCILERPENKPDWKFFQVTFDGYAEGALFGVQGDARGVALEIKTAAARRLFQETFADGGNNTGKPSAELFHDVDAESPAVEGGSVFFHSAF